MPLSVWLGDRPEKLANARRGLNIFLWGKDPVAFCSRTMCRSWPTRHFLVFNIVPFVLPVFSSNQTSSFSPFVPLPLSLFFPSPFLIPPFDSAPSFAHRLASLPRCNFSRHFFPFRQREKSDRKRHKKARARCCQSRHAFFRLAFRDSKCRWYRLPFNR